MTTTQTRAKVPRTELVSALHARDGDMCQHPDCNQKLDFSVDHGSLEVTIDHWIPQWFCKREGWSNEEIWHLDNLKLFHKKCNAKKGDLIPNEDGTLPEKPLSSFRFRRQRRANRPDQPCDTCDNGHNLGVGEVCAQCGCDAQRFPRYAKAKASECDHSIFWCAWCSIGVIPRVGATEMLLIGGEGGE